MEVLLTSPAVVGSIFLFTMGIVGWMIRELYAWIKSLTNDVKELSVIIAGMTADYKNLKEDVVKLEAQISGGPRVRYKD